MRAVFNAGVCKSVPFLEILHLDMIVEEEFGFRPLRKKLLAQNVGTRLARFTTCMYRRHIIIFLHPPPMYVSG